MCIRDRGNGGGKTQTRTYSYIARLNYNYAEKYMVELMGRRDGNSKFAPGYRFKFCAEHGLDNGYRPGPDWFECR